MMTLYHYTCDHGHAALGDHRCRLKPFGGRRGAPATFWWTRYVWLTDLATPMREALGLTSHVLRCDRTRHRYRVEDNHLVEPWTTVARKLPVDQRRAIEEVPGARPKHWYVATHPIRAVYCPVKGKR